MSQQFYQLCFDEKNAKMHTNVVLKQPAYRRNLNKIAIFGLANVGKSCIFNRLIGVADLGKENTFETRTVDFVLPSKHAIRAEFVDAEGGPEQKSILKSQNPTYLDLTGILLVYDVTSKKSFDSVTCYLRKLRLSVPPDCEICLVGNKFDLVTQREVGFCQAEEFAANNGLSLFEVSAKINRNIQEAVAELLLKIREKTLVSPFEVDFAEATVPVVEKSNQQQQEQKKWCSFWFCG